VGVALALAGGRGLSLTTELVVIATGIVVFLTLALATKAVTGRETLVYYHHEVAVLAAAVVVAKLLGAPVLGCLDATAVGLGAFLACGRLGCLLAGCCHGRPARRGVRYGATHVADGFPGYLLDVPLAPVQALEAGCAAGLVLVCIFVVPAAPGEALATYVTGYALIRFCLEQLRGDPARRYWRGLSEAQWTSLLVVGAMSALAAAGVVPGLGGHLLALGVLLAAAPLFARGRRGSLLDARHVRELAGVLPTPRPGRPQVVTSSRGIRLSAGVTTGVGHYTMSRSEPPLDSREAQELARLVSWLRGVQPTRLLASVADSYHLLLPDEGWSVGER